MSKIFIVEDCTKCPNFIPCTSPKDFRVGCTKLGNLGSPLNLIGGGLPIDCPLNDYEEPKTDVLDKIKAVVNKWQTDTWTDNLSHECMCEIADIVAESESKE